MRRALAIAAAALLGAPAAAHAEVTVTGHGFGHGVGLQQWGAYGYATAEGRDARWILGHYYPGTTLGAGPSGQRVRVLLKQSRTQKLCSATRARDARGRSVKLDALRCYRAAAWSDGVALRDTRTGRMRAHLHGTVRVTGGASVQLRGTAKNSRANRDYRGVLRLVRDGRSIAVVDDVSLEQYLWGVVPAESPPSWPAAALQAQAVAARSYALRSLKPTAPFDVLPNTSSQVYGGVEEETAPTTAAVNAMKGLVVKYQGAVAITYFSASSGGRTAPVEEGFPGAAPVPYLVAVDDAHDDLGPYHDWTVTLSDKAAAKRLGDALSGRLQDLAVTLRSASDRAVTVRVTGDHGEVAVPATTIRARLGLRSTWFTVRHETEAR
jgi:stage II sporulation protein D